MSYDSYGDDESGYSWDDDEGGTLTPSGQSGTKTPPVAPPKPIHSNETAGGEYEEEYEDDDEYYDDDEEYYDDGEEGEYYDDDEEYEDEEYEEGEEEEGEYEDEEYEDGEEYDDEEYDDEEYDDEEYDDEEYDDEEYDDEEYEEGDGEEIGTEYESRIEEDDDDNQGWYDGEEVLQPTTVSQEYGGILGKVGGAASNAVQSIRKSLGNSTRQGGGGYVKPPEKDVLGSYGAPNLKIVKNPKPLKERIPQSMRGNNNKLDYSKIKGNLKKGAPTSRPLTGLHKPVNPGKGKGGGRPPSTNRQSHRRRPQSHRKKSKEPASWANKRKNLKKANPNRPLTGLYQPVGGPQPGGGKRTTEMVNNYVPSKSKNQNRGVVKGKKPTYRKDKRENRIQSRRRKLKQAPRERPLTGIYEPTNGRKGPKGQESKDIVESYVPKQGRHEGRNKGGYVKGSKPKYKRQSKAQKLVKARQGLKKGPTKRPLTGLHQPVRVGKGQSSAHTVNNFVPKQKPRNGAKKDI